MVSEETTRIELMRITILLPRESLMFNKVKHIIELVTSAMDLPISLSYFLSQ